MVFDCFGADAVGLSLSHEHPALRALDTQTVSARSGNKSDHHHNLGKGSVSTTCHRRGEVEESKSDLTPVALFAPGNDTSRVAR